MEQHVCNRSHTCSGMADKVGSCQSPYQMHAIRTAGDIQRYSSMLNTREVLREGLHLKITNTSLVIFLHYSNQGRIHLVVFGLRRCNFQV